MITRREFCIGAACCAAVAGKLTGQEGDNSNNEKLVAPCGLYCGACPMYLATQENNDQRMASRFGSSSKQPSAKPPSMENMKCDGCRGGGPTPAHVPKCAIKLCAAEKTKIGICSECAEFPCSRISDFNNDGVQHHGEVLANLRQLRAMGLKDWTKHEEDRWTCPKCRTKFSWYDAECMTCKTPRSDRLFPLKKV